MFDKTYWEQLNNAMTKTNDYVSQLSNYMTTGVLPQQEQKQPEINPMEQEIQGLKDKGYGFEDVGEVEQ